MLPVALQLYSVRDSLEKDFIGTLKAVKEMGYDGVEFAGGLYGHSPEEIRDALKEFDLTPVSSHTNLVEMRTQGYSIFDVYKTIGCKYITVPCISPGEKVGEEKFDLMISDLAKFGVIANLYNMPLCYHNHGHEFGKHANGQYGLDYIYSSVPKELLKAQFDVGFIDWMGIDPAEYIKKYTGRVPMLHLKDYASPGKAKKEDVYTREDAPFIPIQPDEERHFHVRPVGRGLLDVPSIVKAAEEAGVEWLIAEVDEPCLDYNRNQTAKFAIDYLKDINVNK